MVTPLDFTALEQFSGIFPFLLVLVLVYAVLSMTAFFKERQGMAALVAIITALMTLVSKIAINTINLMAPWFVLLVIFGIFFMLVFMMFGYSQENVMNYITSGEFGIGIWVMSILLIIGVGSLATAINEEKGFRALTEGDVGDVSAESQDFGFWQTLFHPKVLGMILVLLVGFFTVKKMASGD